MITHRWMLAGSLLIGALASGMTSLGAVDTPVEERPRTETPPPAKSPIEAKVDELLRRISVLEQTMLEKDVRISDLKARVDELQKKADQLAQQPPPNPNFQQGFTMQMTPEQLMEFNKKMDQHFRNFFNEEHEPGGPEADPLDPFGALGGPRVLQQPAPQPARKPRLGVSLRDVTRDLSAYYKNNADSGAFVVQVVPNTPADAAGLADGDCILAFDGQAVRNAADLIEFVRDAKPGKHQLQTRRRNEKIVLEIKLGEVAEERVQPFREEGGWLRKRDGGDVPNPAPQDGWKEIAEVRTGSLEMTKELSAELSLSDLQRKKMDDVLSRHARKLSSVYNEQTQAGRPLKEADVKNLITQELTKADAELKDVLTEEQLKLWSTYRSKRMEYSISRQMQRTNKAVPDGTNF